MSKPCRYDRNANIQSENNVSEIQKRALMWFVFVYEREWSNRRLGIYYDAKVNGRRRGGTHGLI